MVSLPSNVPSVAYAVILLGDFLVFLLIGLATRLLKPKKLSGVIWVGPVIHLYTLGAVFLALYEAVLSQPLTELVASFGAFLLSAVIGALVGRAVGHRIPVTRKSDGETSYVGGKLLVALIIALLLPLALEQAAVLLGALAGAEALIGALVGASPFNYLLVVLGSLFVLGTFLSITWRFEVWEKRGELPSSPSRARTV